MIYLRRLLNYLLCSLLFVGCTLNSSNNKGLNTPIIYSKFNEIQIFKGYEYRFGVFLDTIDEKRYGVIEVTKDSTFIISLIQCYGPYLNEKISILDTLKINNTKENTVQVGTCSQKGIFRKDIIGIFINEDSSHLDKIVKAYKVDVTQKKIIEIEKSNIDAYDGERDVEGLGGNN